MVLQIPFCSYHMSFILLFSFYHKHILAALLGMTGVWLAFPVAELLTSLLMVIAIVQSVRKMPAKERL